MTVLFIDALQTDEKCVDLWSQYVRRESGGTSVILTGHCMMHRSHTDHCGFSTHSPAHTTWWYSNKKSEACMVGYEENVP